MTDVNSTRSIKGFLVLSLGLAVVTFVDFPGGTLFMNEIQNTGHTFAFGLLAVVVLRLIQDVELLVKKSPIWLYTLAFGISLSAGVLVEIVQSFLGRDADAIDVLRDFAGIVALLGFYSLVDKRHTSSLQKPQMKLMIAGMSALVLISALVPLGRLSISYYHRDQCFPVLVKFGAECSQGFLRLQDSDLAVVHQPNGWPGESDLLVGQMTLRQGEYPGLRVIEPKPDWSAFTSLNIELYSEHSNSFDLVIRVHDKTHDFEFRDRFNKSFIVEPGLNTFRISLADIRLAPSGREMDMTAIAEIILFAVKPQDELIFYVGKLWLE